MIKFVGLINRKPDLSVAAFLEHWQQRHGPIVARVPGVRRYVQSPTLPRWYERRTPPAYDGMAELWFDDWEAWQAALRSPEWQAVQADEENFVDRARSTLIWTDERVIVGEHLPH